MKKMWLMAGAILIAGCNTVPGGPMLGAPVRTPIPAGIYTGRVTGVTRTFNAAGALVGEMPIDQPITVIFDDFGLPLGGEQSSNGSWTGF